MNNDIIYRIIDWSIIILLIVILFQYVRTDNIERLDKNVEIEKRDSINKILKVEVEYLDSMKNVRKVEVENIDNDSTLKLFKQLIRK